FNLDKQEKAEKQHSMMQRLFQKAMEDWLTTKEESKDYNYIQLLNNSFDLMQERLTEAQLNLYKPEVIVPISRKACSTFDFYKAEEMIAYGREQTRLALTKYTKTLS